MNNNNNNRKINGVFARVVAILFSWVSFFFAGGDFPPKHTKYIHLLLQLVPYFQIFMIFTQKKTTYKHIFTQLHPDPDYYDTQITT